MIGSSARSIGPSSRYTVLANNVSILLAKFDPKTMTEPQQRLLERAADLLRKMVQGSKFVERHDAYALSNPSESLFTVGHALNALRSLAKKGEQPTPVTETFEKYESDLRRIAQREPVEPSRVEAIASFFSVLGSLFYSDIADTVATRRQPFFERAEPEEM
jgi:hypothetical protein